jgi:hypothetical protein
MGALTHRTGAAKKILGTDNKSNSVSKEETPEEKAKNKNKGLRIPEVK